MNRYFYSLSYGVGVLLEEINSKLIIKFKEGNKTVALNEAFEIPDDIINNVLFSEYENNFNYNYINRAKEIIDEKRVGNYYIMGKTLKGNVFGHEEYDVSITFFNDEIKANCSCPVRKNCKHAYALLKTFENDLSSFDNVFVSSDNNKEDYTNIIDDYIKDDNKLSRLMLSKKIIKYMDESSDGKLLEILEYIDSRVTKSVTFLSIKRFIIFDTNLYNRIQSLSYNLRYNRFCKGLFDDYKSVTYYISAFRYTRNYELLLEYNFYKDDYKTLIIEFLNLNNIEEGYIDVLVFALNEVILDADIEVAFYKYIDNEYIDDRLIDAIIKKTKNILYLKRIIEKGIDIALSSSLIHFLKIDEILEVYELFKCDDRLLKYINDNFYEFLKYDVKKLAYVLVNSNKVNRSVLAEDLISRLPNNYYLLKYINNDINYSDIDSELFFYYFTPTYELKRTNTLNHINYYVKFNHDLIISFIYRNGELLFYKPNNISKSQMDNLFALVNKELEKDSEYKMLIDNYNKEVRKSLQSKNELAITNIIDKHLTNDIKLSNKAHLELSIYPDEFECDIELKVGIDKLYVIKNIKYFLALVIHKENYSYGKGLTFNHSIDNFDELSKSIINLLLMLGDSTSDYHYSTRKFGITSHAANKLIEIHKDNYLLINDKKYFVRLENRKAEYYIDDRYRLNCSLPFDTVKIGDKLYLYAEGNNLDILNSTNDNDFDSLMQDLCGQDISFAIDRFKEDVYYKYQNLIKIDQNISEDFIINDVRIEAYFDYDDNKIFVETKLFKNDIEVDETSLDKNDKIKVINYINYLTSMGVHENKIDDEEYIYLFFTMDFTELKELCFVYLSDSIKNKSVIKMTPPTIRIKYNNNLMDVFVEENNYTDEELYKILKAIKKKKKYLLLDDDRIIDINNDESKDFLDAVDEMIGKYDEISKPIQIPFYQAIKAFSYQNNTTIDEYLINMYYELTSFKKANYPLPKISGELRQYQKEGYNFLKILSKYNLGGILADDMGLGKTLEIISLLASDDLVSPSLVVCPKSLIFNWAMEIEKFTPGCKVVSIVGDQKVRHRIINGIDNLEKIIYITAYDSLRNDINNYAEKHFNYLILDEAQFIKNVSATKSKTVKMIKSNHRFALTGTPIENNIIDLWSIFDFIMPGYLDNLSSFKMKYSANKDYEKVIINKTKLFILRRTKKEVLSDLPEKYERIVSCEMSSAQQALYEAYKLQARKAMEDGEDQLSILKYLVRLRQICVDPKTFVENYDGESAKMNELYKIIDEYIYDGHKILIFSSFVKALENIEVFLRKNNINYLKLTGETKIDERSESVRLFNTDKNIKIFLISLKAGGTGLNLVGADTVIHLDPWWNIAAMDQASDRAHRIGQKRNVEVIKLVCEDSIEQRVIELQNIKKDLIDRLISKDDSSITNFDIKDLGYILK